LLEYCNVHHLIVCLLTESRRAAIDVLLKAAGYLDCAIRHVLPQIPPEIRSNMSLFLFYTWSSFSSFFIETFACREALPIDLAEVKLRALCMQALGQVNAIHP